MISKQTVYLNENRTKAVAEGDPGARFLLVREGMEIDLALAEKYDGATDLIGSASKAKPEKAEPIQAPNLKGASSAPVDAGPAPTNREQAMPKRRTRKAAK